MKTKLTILSLITVGALAIAFADEHTDKVMWPVNMFSRWKVRNWLVKPPQTAKTMMPPVHRSGMKADTCCSFTRSETSFAAGANASIGKARTAAVFKADKDFEDTINRDATMTACLTSSASRRRADSRGQVIGVPGRGAARSRTVAKAGAAAVADTKVAAK
jgi:hypothetical protein